MKPLIIYDNACSVCVRQVQNLQQLLPRKFEIDSFREAGFSVRHPNVPLEACEKALQFVNSNGKRFSGAEAVAQAMGLAIWTKPLVWLYYVPGLRRIWDAFYAWIARNRF